MDKQSLENFNTNLETFLKQQAWSYKNSDPEKMALMGIHSNIAIIAFCAKLLTGVVLCEAKGKINLTKTKENED